MMQYKSLIIIVFSFIIFFSSCAHQGSVIESPSLTDMEGQAINFEGKITIINVWATWCGTCISEMPDLNRIHQKYKDHPEIQFIAFADEDQKKVEKALNRWRFTYRQVVDARSFTRGLKSGLVKTYPQNIVLNKDGEIVFEHTDGSSDIFTVLDDKIQSLLKH